MCVCVCGCVLVWVGVGGECLKRARAKHGQSTSKARADLCVAEALQQGIDVYDALDESLAAAPTAAATAAPTAAAAASRSNVSDEVEQQLDRLRLARAALAAHEDGLVLAVVAKPIVGCCPDLVDVGRAGGAGRGRGRGRGVAVLLLHCGRVQVEPAIGVDGNDDGAGRRVRSSSGVSQL